MPCCMAQRPIHSTPRPGIVYQHHSRDGNATKHVERHEPSGSFDRPFGNVIHQDLSLCAFWFSFLSAFAWNRLSQSGQEETSKGQKIDYLGGVTSLGPSPNSSGLGSVEVA